TNPDLVRLMASESKTDSKELLKEALLESKKREQLLMPRLTTKERELCQCLQQLEQLRAQSASTASTQLKAMMLDPAVNVLYQRLRKELGDCRDRLEQTQNDLSAWKFTPDSQTGKRLMARIRQLHQENSELSQGMSSAAVAKMESEIALEKTLLVEMRKTHTEQEHLLGEIDDETESLQSTILIMQGQLSDAYLRIEALRLQLHAFDAGAASGYRTAAPDAPAAPASNGGQSGFR
ncbi:hypothetical protein BOX15_Mlig024903g4, partial [Macrostomum lignano]